MEMRRRNFIAVATLGSAGILAQSILAKRSRHNTIGDMGVELFPGRDLGDLPKVCVLRAGRWAG